MLADAWLASLWPFVRAQLPGPPASVLEIGCGPAGGFVPELLDAGYGAVGVDPKAPAGPAFRRCAYEQVPAIDPVDAVIACTSLHHVADLDVVLDRVRGDLRAGGTVVVVEWAWERFDEATARWCFARLAESGPGGWLRRHRDRWAASGGRWSEVLGGWAEGEGLHRGEAIVRALDERFTQTLLEDGPYVFADLAVASEDEERRAIADGEIQATGIRYVGVRS